ncbi:MAG: class I SAM-dependent methyltransferase [Acidimicrobiales bacterium]
MSVDPGQLLPEKPRLAVGQYYQYRREAREFKARLATYAGDRVHTVPVGPVAPPEIIETTALMKRDELRLKSRRNVFHSSGYRAMRVFLEAAVGAGLRLDRADAAFELGCGGARLIRHLRSVRGLRLVASDLQAEVIVWCKENVPDVEFHMNGLMPPLGFADDDSFDFAFAYSVFTHITMDLQLPWIAELARVLKPGGLATVTTLGTGMARKMMSGEEFSEFQRQGTYTMNPEHPRVSESSAVLGSWDVFMTEDHLRALFEPAMQVVAYKDAPQALVVLKKA